MKTQNVLFAALIMLFACGCGSSLNPAINKFNSNSNGWKPAEFNPETGVLLIEKIVRPKGQQRKMEEFMAKNYKYKYEFVDLKELPTSKYTERSNYRFFLRYALEQRTVTSTSAQGMKTRTIGLVDFYLVDRLNVKNYPKSGIPSSYAFPTFKKVIEALLENK